MKLEYVGLTENTFKTLSQPRSLFPQQKQEKRHRTK